MKNAFTLVEVMIWVVVLSIIAAIVIHYVVNKPNNYIVEVKPVEFYNVQFLFETNGIKVYKFHEWGKSDIYFTDVRGKIEWKSTSGKVTKDNSVEMVGE